MSREMPVPVSLEDILKRQSIIVVRVKKRKPFSVKQKQRLRKIFLFGPYFTHFTDQYTVEEILYPYNDVQKIKVGQDISVRRANYHTHFNRHKVYRLKQMSKSIYTYHYDKGIDISAVDEAIIYIMYKEEDKVFEYCVQKAYDNLDKKEEVLNILRAVKK